jgi:EAL domain-containing protein (putative c-di-GMP-specific phosphodiesterase class I)
MAHLETQSEFNYRTHAERFLQELPAKGLADSVVRRYRLLAERNTKLPKFDEAIIRQYMEAMLDGGGFFLHYQPQYSAVGDLLGLEALLRLPHPELGFIEPSVFIRMAEESGLIEPLGLWVIREVCQQMKRWNDEFHAVTRVSVNVSPLQLSGINFTGKVLDILAECGADPTWLELEITERVLLNCDEIAGPVQTLSEAGIRFAMDDVGIGYSSLYALQRLPFSTLKIDHFFCGRDAARRQLRHH